MRAHVALSDGSSPRGRGTPWHTSNPAPAPRFIPARAGNTPLRPSCPASRPVHPRAGGEHLPTIIREVNETGSSPRGRGTQPRRTPRPPHQRFIPARAGNTHPRQNRIRQDPVHPRAGGEHTPRTTPASATPGSSPRGRGTHARPAPAQPVWRFIPARAGNTSWPVLSIGFHPVHPRAGGEHGRPSFRRMVSFGSSPRGRGTRRGRTGRRRHPRFIPARAGNTLPAGH